MDIEDACRNAQAEPSTAASRLHIANCDKCADQLTLAFLESTPSVSIPPRFAADVVPGWLRRPVRKVLDAAAERWRWPCRLWLPPAQSPHPMAFSRVMASVFLGWRLPALRLKPPP